jgi:hypothetical protein
MQAAQNVSQVFLGVNLKCAGCHDSFVSDWTLADAYGPAAVFTTDKPLELVHCDRPTGQTAPAQFLYPEIGGIDPGPRPRRAAQAVLRTDDQLGQRPAVRGTSSTGCGPG